MGDEVCLKPGAGSSHSADVLMGMFSIRAVRRRSASGTSQAPSRVGPSVLSIVPRSSPAICVGSRARGEMIAPLHRLEKDGQKRLQSVPTRRTQQNERIAFRSIIDPRPRSPAPCRVSS